MNKGFTIIETLVAITILIIGVLGPLSLAANAISDGLFAQNQLTANLLAQEAIEAFVNKRNSNVLTDPEPSHAFNDLTPTLFKSFSLNSVNGVLSGSGCPFAGCKLDYVNGVYTEVLSGGLFNRKIVSEYSNTKPEQLKVTVTISWLNKSVPKSFTTAEYLYYAK